MEPVTQEEQTGCGIASAAAIAGVSYREAKGIANAMGIHADDPLLWSDSMHVRRVLSRLGVRTGEQEMPFTGWESLPDCALLATKWHVEGGKPCWHWAVFVRDGGGEYVLDSKKALKRHRRTDFGRIRPKWSIEVFR